MADNLTVTPGTGATVAMDEVTDGTLGSVKVQFVKLMDGTLDGTQKAKVLAASTAPVATDPALVVAISPNGTNANGQAPMANSAPVTIASNQSAVSITSTQLGAALGQTTMSASMPVAIASNQSAVTVAGAAASGASASGNPVPGAGLAVSSETVVTNGQAAALVTDLARKLIVLPYANPENFVSGAITSAMTGTTSTSLIAAPAAGLRNYITQITVSNSHATVGTDIIIQDGSGGTTLYTIPAAAVYGGAVVSFPTPLRQPTTATAIFCANVTNGASTKVSASGYKGA